MYDVIIVGARVAGSTTAMLLARHGLKVLCLDRASFPSDTLSTHNVQLPGVARLKKWGLLDAIIAAGTPAVRDLRFDPGPVVIEGSFPAYEGANAVYGPRRTILDNLLVDAARAAGAEVREGFVAEEIVTQDGRVIGIRGRQASGAMVTETARLVIGADGKHSMVAEAVGAPMYNQKPALTCAYYTYWQDVRLTRGEMYSRPRRAIGAWPTNDGLVMTYVGAPASEFHAIRSDIEGNVLASLDQAGDLGQRVRAGKRVERFYGGVDLPNFFRKPYGPGWALVGDAGLVMDPITAQGISDAFRDAELLTNAVASGLDGDLEAALAGYEKQRNGAVQGMYDFTAQIAALAPPKVEERVLFESLLGRPQEIERFFGFLTGAVPAGEYFTPGNLRRVIGMKGLLRIILGKITSRGSTSPEPALESSAA